VQQLERELAIRVEVCRAIDRAEPAGGDLRRDTEPLIEHLAEQRIAAFDNGALAVFVFPGHAHARLYRTFAIANQS
jgi:hypothetical protein